MKIKDKLLQTSRELLHQLEIWTKYTREKTLLKDYKSRNQFHHHRTGPSLFLLYQNLLFYQSRNQLQSEI